MKYSVQFHRHSLDLQDLVIYRELEWWKVPLFEMGLWNKFRIQLKIMGMFGSQFQNMNLVFQKGICVGLFATPDMEGENSSRH